jgi:hypothetical protein
MSVAQTRAARRKFKLCYGKVPIGHSRYKRKSVMAMERREQQLREKMKVMAGRKSKKKGR